MDSQDLFLEVIVVLLGLVIIILHSFGCYCLLCNYKQGKDDVNQIYLINLSINEALGEFIAVSVLHIPKLTKLFGIHLSCTFEMLQIYCVILLYAVFSFVYYTNMVYICLDKLMDIVLNIKYNVYWNKQRAKKLLVATWFIGCLIWLSLSVSTYYTHKHATDLTGKCTKRDFYTEKFVGYFYPTFDVLFFIVASISYGFIFHKFKQTRLLPAQISFSKATNSRTSVSSFKAFRQSRFYIPVLLVLTFILLVVVPDIINLVYSIILHKESKILDRFLLICFQLSYLNDAIIYIFIQQQTRRILRRKMMKVKCCILGKAEDDEVILNRHVFSIRNVANENLVVDTRL